MNWLKPRLVASTDLQVTAVGLGCASLAGVFAETDASDAAATIAEALRAGITYFDVAPRYGSGVAEKRLGEGLRGVPRDKYVLSTKVGWRIVDDRREPDFTRDGVLRSIDASLARLGVDRIDMLFVHDPDGPDFERAALDDVFPVLVDLRNAGVIGAIGAGMNHWQPLKRFVEEAPIDCVLMASRFTLLDQSALPLIETCEERNVSVIAGGVFNTGILASGSAKGGNYDYKPASPEIIERVRALEAVCDAHGVTLQGAALQFALLRPAIASVLIGAATPRRLAESLAGIEAPIPRSFWNDLEERALIAPGCLSPPTNWERN